MYLSKLEIHGFKSFANKTVINFTKGITGIVGPNGCGKTNIVDALRWCLGEQKSSTLRSDKMENVIFNGTRNKKPMGMSEVSLTLVNDSGMLPTEYTEVTITRRIFRSGESEYLLNKNICRLKDITNLFMDTGMGTNAYSVIELKMVETILSNKAEERRKMFEEAAGVNKYKMRRRLSLKKLDEVKSDLVRVNDIVSEVEKNVRSLERQAKKADRYNTIQSELREKELDLAEREFAHFKNQIEIREASRNEYIQRKDTTDTQIREIENKLIVYRQEINTVEKDLSEKQLEISRKTEKLHNSQKNISVAEERINSIEKNIERFTQEIQELQYQKEEIEVENEKLDEIIADVRNQIEKKESDINSHIELLEQKKNRVTEKRQILKAKTDEVNQSEKVITNKENTFKNLIEQREKANQINERLNEKIQRLTTDIAKTVGYLEELTDEKKEAEKRLQESESRYVAKQNEKSGLERKLNQLKEKELDEKSILNSIKDKVDFLQTLITNLEGVSKGSKVLIESEGWTEKDKTLFADVGNTDEKFRFAIEASLKSVINNLLIEDITDLKRAIEYLKKNDLGKASFYLLQHPNNGKKTFLEKIQEFSNNRKANKLTKEDKFLNWALELVKTDVKWLPYFKKVLTRTAVTDSLDDALQLHSIYPQFNFVTLNGDLVNSEGIIEAGSSPKLDETLFGRKQLLESLKNDYPKYNENLNKIRKEIEETEEKISGIDLKVLSDKGKILVNEITNIEKQISQIEFEKKKANEEIDKSQDEIQETSNMLNTLYEQISELEIELNELNEKKNNVAAGLKTLEDELTEIEDDFQHAQTEQNNRQVELERLKGQLQNSQNSLSNNEQTKANTINTIAKREEDISKGNEEIGSVNNIIEENQIVYDELTVERDRLTNEKDEIEKKLNSIKDEASNYEKQLNDLRYDRQDISEKIHEVDMKLNELNFRLENLIEHIREEYNSEIELKEFDDLEEFNFKERSAEVHQLKEKIKNLGPINLLAYSEYEEESERLEFLSKQRNDLIDSEKDLINSINEINETAQTLFRDTFEEIRSNFKNIFQTLFDPGDEADLLIEESADPLEAKIEIIAKPKGKRPTSIELLSGGEKTLTATALLFAIYLVKPSPFCVLDEVDAPLDDANIDRFTKLLKEFSNNTQFIIVTHNKRTMESSENMYGVTMQEEGISKLAAVQFNDELDFVEAS
ncbi:MAG: chromosome segregation protein SMC [Melioribacteraceae bacterium]|nr:chromosome segregation protein SMC [Melioribacteraceae bacterium]MCF8353508.1 chromosome segregation protein SMC [Melioribacteraceae bacterium]MCF8392637.1 chromosome segregation protein SMC [Melioribacteraceae bacterium]MCF8418491.1 chromosome segregation protein SMC [Melioribacteraceae bacterium]